MDQLNSNRNNLSRSLYLTEADPHGVVKRVQKPLDTHELRRQIFLLLIFWDNLVLSDAILNNNPKMRPLLIPEIEKPDPRFANVQMDFKHFLRKGYIKAAMREDKRSFTELLKEHQEEPVPAPDLPKPEYTQALDELIPETSRLRWERRTVESYFKQNLINVFSSRKPRRDYGIPPETSQAMLRFIKSKGDKPINYRELRDLIQHPDKYEHILQSPNASMQMREKRYSDALEEVISGSYRFNVPRALELECETTRDSLPIGITFGDTSIWQNNQAEGIDKSKKQIRPCWVFDEEVLGQVPAEAIDGVKSLSSYREFVSKLRRPTTPSLGNESYERDLVEAWEFYTQDLEKHLRGEISARLMQEVSDRQRRKTQAFITGLVLTGLEVLVTIYFPLAQIPFIGFDIYTGWKSYKDYKRDLDQIASLGRLTGKPVIRRYEEYPIRSDRL